MFCVNRSSDRQELAFRLAGFETLGTVEHTALTHPNLKATNASDRQTVAPGVLGRTAVNDGRATVALPARSWNVLRILPR